jgi:competence protein ComGC
MMITTVLLVLIILVVLVLMLNIPTYANANDASYAKANDAKTNAIKSILRGSSRYALASLQDRSPMIALLHANYGAGYFWAMRDAFNSTDIENATHIKILDYEKKITDIQDASTKEVVKACPQFATNVDLSLAKIANEL